VELELSAATSLGCIEGTHAPDIHGEFNRRASEEMVDGVRWLGLDGRSSAAGGALDTTANGEFIVRCINDSDEHAR
jgi:hypothetical protein